MELFTELKAQDRDFQYVVKADSESRITTLMWTSGKSVEQYRCFGDVVTFDTTYKTNIYDMPFGLFVGVNNHFQSVIFAGVLVRNETEETFKWVFSEFVRMMGGKPPKTILTDQARAMELGIRAVYPEAAHRWCKWHVLKKAKEHLGALLAKESPFKPHFNKVVHHMLTEDEFEMAWSSLVDTYRLRDSPFMTHLYETKRKWAKPFFMGVFCAKMTSTQRSKSANHMLKSYVPPGSSMHLFVQQYQKLQFDRESEEAFEEKKSRVTKAMLKANLPIERHASQIYTRAMFGQFSDILYGGGAYEVEEKEPRVHYSVKHVDAERRDIWCRTEFAVTVYWFGEFFACECGQFDHMGVICCHASKVMIYMGLRKIPKRHILKRWTLMHMTSSQTAWSAVRKIKE